MKESEKLYIAMNAVLDSEYSNEIKLDVLELLIDKRKTALFCEKNEEEENNERL